MQAICGIKIVSGFRKTVVGVTGLLGLLCGSFSWAKGAPLVLFNLEDRGRVVYYSIDCADPGLPAPSEITSFPLVKGSRTLGIFNGILYLGLVDGGLAAIDTATGNSLNLDLCLPENFLHEDGMIYGISTGKRAIQIEMIDLRGPYARQVTIPASDWSMSFPSPDRLRRIVNDDVAYFGDREWVTGHIEDVRKIDMPPLQVSFVFPMEWRFEPPHWMVPGNFNSELTVVRGREPTAGSRITWAGSERFAVIALDLDIEGFSRLGEVDGESQNLFVVDLTEGAIRGVPLSTLPQHDVKDASNYYPFDAEQLSFAGASGSKAGANPRRLSEHFVVVNKSGRLQVLHGAEPLRVRRDPLLKSFELGPDGTQVYLRFADAAVSYDVYAGYFGATKILDHYAPMDEADLVRVRRTLPPGWNAILAEAGVPESPDRHENPASASTRRERSEYYSLAAVVSQSRYPEDSEVAITATLFLNTANFEWTEPPSLASPILTGTLAAPEKSVPVARLSGVSADTSALPAVLLSPWERLSYTFKFTPEEPGDYTLALAYQGNSEVHWRGCARAPLVHFTIGDRPADTNARLRFAIRDFINRHGEREDPLFEQIREKGEEGLDVVVEVLRDISPPRIDPYQDNNGDIFEEYASVGLLYSYLTNLHSPHLVPFFRSLLTDENQDLEHHGIVGLEWLRQHSKDPELQATIVAIFREEFMGEDPIKRAELQQYLKFELDPGLYESLKMRVASEDPKESADALKLLAELYLWRQNTFEGDMEIYTRYILDNDRLQLSYAAASCIARFYGREVDRPGILRAIDEYRVRYPRVFDRDFMSKRYELWDFDWLRRVGEDPTEARLVLLMRSIHNIEAHCGMSRPLDFPETWKEFNESESARNVFFQTMKAWTECFRLKPTTFRLPSL